MIRNTFTLFLGFLLLLLFSCEEKTGPLDNNVEPFAITPFSVPARINISRAKVYSVAYKVTHPDGGEAIKSVTAFFLTANNDTLLILQLLDDGGVQNPDGKDVLAKDGIYTNTFISDSTIIPAGEVFIHASAVDATNQMKIAEAVTALAGFNKAPVIVSVSAPDTLPSGTPPLLFAAMVQDSNGIDDVPSVLMRLKKQGNTIFTYQLPLLNTTAVDSGQFGAFFDSTFAAERIGNYELEFQAEDLSEDLSNTISRQIFLENTAPFLYNQELPDTVQRPSGNEVLSVFVRVSAKDSQGLEDILTVTIVIQRTGGDPATLEMFDDGDFDGHGDEVAGDGIYSRGLSVDSSSTAATFFFTFQAKDKVNNTSNAIIDSLIVLP